MGMRLPFYYQLLGCFTVFGSLVPKKGYSESLGMWLVSGDTELRVQSELSVVASTE